MTRQFVIDDKGGHLEQPTPTPAGPDTPAMVHLLLRAHLMRGALDEARASADLLERLEGQGGGISLLIEAALDLGRVQLARLALAEAEGKGRMPPGEVPLMRARIAHASGDLVAARAILVAAIEAMPDQIAPRRALTEVMVAMGTAADARSVLSHLGAAADSPPAE